MSAASQPGSDAALPRGSVWTAAWEVQAGADPRRRAAVGRLPQRPTVVLRMPRRPRSPLSSHQGRRRTSLPLSVSAQVRAENERRRKYRYCTTHTHTHTSRFTALFPGLPTWAGARRNLLVDFVVQGEISEADMPTIWLGATPSRLISDPPLVPHFYAGCPSSCNPPNLSWLTQAPNMLDWIPSGLV